MKIAIVGATSQIARDLTRLLSAKSSHELSLFARRPDAVATWLSTVGLADRHRVGELSDLHQNIDFDVILNFVGVGNPAQAQTMGSSIFEVTLKYDQLVLEYLDKHPACRYLFLSSGAAYGGNFLEPASFETAAALPLNSLGPQDWYSAAKVATECRHRALSDANIVDVRVFSYFSHTHDIEARFFITDILRAIRDGVILRTSADFIVRDFLHPSDFYQLVSALLGAPPANGVVDCYSRAPVDKPTLLDAMSTRFGLAYETVSSAGVNATGHKTHYYSVNTKAAEFGYKPKWSSLDGVLEQSERLLAAGRRQAGA